MLTLSRINKSRIFYFLGLNKNKPSSSKDLDVTLMCAIIRNLNYITKPTNGWGKEPRKSDIRMADDVERIRHYRNSLCHDTSTEMETDVFNNTALELIWVICNAPRVYYKYKISVVSNIRWCNLWGELAHQKIKYTYVRLCNTCSFSSIRWMIRPIR